MVKVELVNFALDLRLLILSVFTAESDWINVNKSKRWAIKNG